MDNSNVTPLHPKEKNKKQETSLVSSLSPREIVSELDRFVVGQNKAKKAVAVALRTVSYTHLRAHETDSYLVCRLLLEKKKNSMQSSA